MKKYNLIEELTGIHFPEEPKPTEREIIQAKKEKRKNAIILIFAIIALYLFITNSFGFRDYLTNDGTNETTIEQTQVLP